MVFSRLRLVYQRAFKQDGCLFAAGGAAAGNLVETRTNCSPRCLAVAALLRRRDGAGLGDIVAGANPSWCPRAGMGLQFSRTLPDSRSRRMVLCGQIMLARKSHVHVSTLADQCRPVVAMDFSGGGIGAGGDALVLAPANWARAIGGGAAFWRHAPAGAGLRQCLSDALHLCRGSLPISGQHRAVDSGSRRNHDGFSDFLRRNIYGSNRQVAERCC